MKNKIKEIGAFGESCAAKYLRRHGYRIIDRNIRSSHKETDIIAQSRDTLAFVEVKTRMADAGNSAAAAVNPEKRRNLLYAARSYLANHGSGGKNISMDVIEVYLQERRGIFSKYKVKSINHIINAFDASGRVNT